MWAQPSGKKWGDTAWVEAWESVEFIRLLVADPSAWDANFTSPLWGALSPEELLAHPSFRGKEVWVTTDATPHLAGGVDWTGHKCFRRNVKVDIIALILCLAGEEGLTRSEMEEQCSNVFELVAFITLVILRGPFWAGCLVIWGGG